MLGGQVPICQAPYRPSIALDLNALVFYVVPIHRVGIPGWNDWSTAGSSTSNFFIFRAGCWQLDATRPWMPYHGWILSGDAGDRSIPQALWNTYRSQKYLNPRIIQKHCPWALIMTATHWYVITGAPSSGKTTLLRELEKAGYRVIHEVARTIIESELAQGRTLKQIRSDKK